MWTFLHVLSFCLISVYICLYVYLLHTSTNDIFPELFKRVNFLLLNKHLSVYFLKTGTFSYITTIQLSRWDRIPEPPSAAAQALGTTILPYLSLPSQIVTSDLCPISKNYCFILCVWLSSCLRWESESSPIMTSWLEVNIWKWFLKLIP